jgi:hypothetical protein
MLIKTWRTVLVAGLLLISSAATAMQNPNQSRGFTGPMIGTGIDSISPYNGGLTVSIPLGDRYPVSAGLGYGLRLTYNSHLWNYETVWAGGFFTEAEPQRNVTAGLGWLVTMGKIYSPNSPPFNPSGNWVYLTPDGGAHSFWDDLHRNEDDGDNTVLYTRDNSYLRMKKLPSGWVDIEFPNGTVHQFAPGGSGGGMSLRRIDDA